MQTGWSSETSRKNRVLSAALAFVLVLVFPSPGIAQSDERLNNLPLPIRCDLGTDCFVQNLPDLDASAGVTDSFCGSASYDGHKGTDFRVRSLRDMKRGVDVLAVLSGSVRAIRDEMPDQIISSEAQRKEIEGRECGNGVVISHGDGLETQYCHLQLGSVVVEAGDEVQAGDVLGKVGTSGSSQFPHVHLSIRKDGEDVDPNTGGPVSGASCVEAAAAKPVWGGETPKYLKNGLTQVMRLQFSGTVPNHDGLVVDGGPQTAEVGDQLSVGWAWVINLQEGDRIAMMIRKDGAVFAEATGEPLDKPQAAYSRYIGKRSAVESGTYELEVRVLRDGSPVIEETGTFTVQ